MRSDFSQASSTTNHYVKNRRFARRAQMLQLAKNAAANSRFHFAVL